jgi:hypothetical protein
MRFPQPEYTAEPQQKIRRAAPFAAVNLAFDAAPNPVYSFYNVCK